MLEHDAIGVGPPFGRVVGVPCSTGRFGGHVDVHVALPGPVDELLHVVVALIGQLILDAVDARMAVPLRIALGESELDVHIGCDVHKARHDLPRVGVHQPEIPVEDLHRVLDLRVGNVLRAVVMDDMEDHGDDVQFVVLSTSGQHILSRSAGLGFRRLAGSAGSRVSRIEGRLGFGLSTGPDILGVGQGKQAGQGQGGQGESKVHHHRQGGQFTPHSKRSPKRGQ